MPDMRAKSMKEDNKCFWLLLGRVSIGGKFECVPIFVNNFEINKVKKGEFMLSFRISCVVFILLRFRDEIHPLLFCHVDVVFDLVELTHCCSCFIIN